MPNNTRDESFVPLTPAIPPANQRADFQVAILSQAQHAQPFRPLAPRAAGQTASAAGPGCEPRVTVQRDGDRVTAIHIQCACGHVMELACVYDSAPKANS